MTSAPSPTKPELFDALTGVSLAAERRLRRRLAKAHQPKALAAIAKDIAAARAKVDDIAAALPAEITFPEALPVTARREDIAEAIDEHQVVIIAGETGSGKTTQIPKICLELGRGRRGLIGHTQPRRLAARTVAERIADELGQDIGESVGYAIRFDDRVGQHTAVKLMTDGILLAEMQHDRFLNAYDTIIIDEAHERSLNIDFLLGYLKRLLPKRPDLKVIITSATIDPERFAAHFAEPDGTPAPIVEVSGRTYPVEIRYRPLETTVGERSVDIDPLDGLASAIEELMAEGPGDILCFFPGERDIRDAQEALAGKRWRGVEITPLFGRLSNQEQHRVFSPHAGRRIVLATNIAETSLTVPGIHYVVDTGTARISRYSTRTKVQRLPIEEISQASANQRSGRCGRVAEGIAIRLYSEEDYQARPEFTDPEILRTNLASVILQMASLRLGDITAFPFVQAPEPKAIRDGVALLHELGAIVDKREAEEPKLTAIGRDLARIPVDPRLARMLVEAHRRGCLEEVSIIVAALTTQDIRERPLDHQAQADQQHARFKDAKSDFLSYLKLWDYLETQRAELSGNAYRKKLKAEFLHYMRSREWRDLVRQLREVTGQLGWKTDGTQVRSGQRDTDAIHRSLLAGLLMRIGARDGAAKEFLGTRGARFLIFPGSALAKRPPEFIMAGEIVETSRLWARDVAAIDPAWVEEQAGTLVKHSYSEPFWSTKRAGAMAHEKATLLGVTLVADRVVPYHRVDPAAAREMFIRSALIDGQWRTHHTFFHDNAAKLADAAVVEDKARRRGLVADEDALFDFYDQRLPETITTGAHFDSWWKKTRRQDPDLLDFDPARLVSGDDAVTEEAFPDTWRQWGTSALSDVTLELSYVFEPGNPKDGVCVSVPIPLLAGIDARDFQWLVPGLRVELYTELIRTLPKAARRSVVPAPDFAARAASLITPGQGTVAAQLAEALRTLGGSGINEEDFRFQALPPHLRMTFCAVDRRGKIVDFDKNLGALQRRQAQHITSSMAKLTAASLGGGTPQPKGKTSPGQGKRGAAKPGKGGTAGGAGATAQAPKVTEWTEQTLGAIPETVTTHVDGHEVAAYPALVVHGQTMTVQAMPTKAAADAAMLRSTMTLLMRSVSVQANQMVKGLPLQQRVGVDHYPHGGAAGLVEEARIAAIRDLMLAHGGPVRDPAAFAKLRDAVAPEVPGLVRKTVVTMAPALVEYLAVRDELSGWEGPAIDDMRRQLEFLLPPNAVVVHGLARMKHLGRFFKAMQLRLAEMSQDPDRDADRQDQVEEVIARLAAVLKTRPAGAEKTTAVKDIQWQIEEFRVSLFAQRLGTAQPVSARRIIKAIEKL